MRERKKKQKGWQEVNKSIYICKNTILSLCFALPLFGQDVEPKENSIVTYLMTHTMSNTDKVYQQLSRNLSAYMIYQYAAQDYNPPVISSFFFDEILNNAFPPCDKIGSEFAIDLRESTIKLPNRNYGLHYTLLEFEWPGMLTQFKFGNEYRVMGSTTDYNPLYSPLMEKGLIAVNSDSSSIIFISGYMFLHNICDMYFPDNQFTDSAIHDYVTVRYYNYEPKIEKIGVAEQECVFYSKVMRKRYRVVFIYQTGREYVYNGIYDRLEELPDDK